MQISVLTKLFADRSLDAACETAADLGFDAVELMGRDPHFGPETTTAEADELRALLDDLGLEVSCVASYTGGYLDKEPEERERELDRLDHFCELAQAVGCPRIRHGPGGPPEHRASDEDYEEAIEWMRRACDVAAAYNVDLLVEIHSLTVVESAESARRLIEGVDRDNLGAMHDAGNMYISRKEYGPDAVEMLGDHLDHVHVKDELRVADEARGTFELETPVGDELFQPRLLGDGAVDHGPLFAALQNTGYDGYVTLECHVPPHDTLTDRAIAECELHAARELLAAEN